MPRTGYIDHIGIGVSDMAAAKRYYDALMPILGLKVWFPGATLNFGPDGGRGSQVFFYQASEPSPQSRHGPGLHHLAFMVESRAIVREAHAWAVEQGAEILDPPGDFPQYGQHYATYWLGPDGIKLEVVTFEPEQPAG